MCEGGFLRNLCDFNIKNSYPLISLVFGLMSIVQMLYYSHRLNIEYEELGVFSDVITLFKYSTIEFYSFIIFQIISYFTAIISVIQRSIRLGILGLILSTIATFIFFC
jgi:hypothetical protein